MFNMARNSKSTILVCIVMAYNDYVEKSIRTAHTHTHFND